MADAAAGKWLKFLIVRMLAGFFFGYVLTRVFMPERGFGTVVLMAALLVIFAYVFEAMRRN